MDKIKHLIKLEDALKSKLKMIREGKRQQKLEQIQQKLRTTESSGRGSLSKVQRKMSDLHLNSAHQNRNYDLDEDNDESVMIIDESQQEIPTPKGKTQAKVTQQKHDEETLTMMKQGSPEREEQNLPFDSTTASISNPTSTQKSSALKINSNKLHDTDVTSKEPSSCKKTKLNSSFVSKTTSNMTNTIQKQAHQQNFDRNRQELLNVLGQQTSLDIVNSNNQPIMISQGDFISQSDDGEDLIPKLKRRRVEDSE